jgi:hypothetical protein
VPTPGRLERLANERVLTVMLRLVIARDGQLVHGEIVDLEGVVRHRFVDWPGLVAALERLIATTDSDG